MKKNLPKLVTQIITFLKSLANWKATRDFIISGLEKIFINWALKKALGSAIMGGFKAWLVRLITTKLYDELAKPIIELAIRKGYLLYDIKKGKLLLKDINRAKDNKNEADYIDSISDV